MSRRALPAPRQLLAVLSAWTVMFYDFESRTIYPDETNARLDLQLNAGTASDDLQIITVAP